MAIVMTLTLTATIVTIAVVAYVEMQDFLVGSVHGALEATTEAVVAVLDDRQDPSETEHEIRHITGASPHKRSGRFRVWIDGESKDLFGSHPPGSADADWLHAVASGEGPGLDSQIFMSSEAPTGPFEIIWARRQIGGRTVNVLVAASKYYVRHEMDEFLRLLLILGGAMVLGSGTVAVIAVLASLRPIARTAEAMRTITARNLGSFHAESPAPPEELRPFVEAMEAMLARLDAAIRRQKQFTGDASHELRTPLALAKSTLQAVICGDGDPADYRRAIVETLADIDRMERLTSQLLALARMDETPACPPDSTALDELLPVLAAAHNAEAERKGGGVICAPLPPARAAGREGDLRQLFDNLIENAVKHGPNGGTVRIDLLAEGPDRVVVTVHDEGGGIPPEALGRLFDRFYRVDSARSSHTGGTGLGLAIARAAAERCGGSVEISSNAAEGTTARVRLPVRTTPAVPPPRLRP